MTLVLILRASAPPPLIPPTPPTQQSRAHPHTPRKQHSTIPAHAKSNDGRAANEEKTKSRTEGPGGRGGMSAGRGGGVEGTEAEAFVLPLNVEAPRSSASSTRKLSPRPHTALSIRSTRPATALATAFQPSPLWPADQILI